MGGRVWFNGRHGMQGMKAGFHGSPAVGEEPPLRKTGVNFTGGCVRKRRGWRL